MTEFTATGYEGGPFSPSNKVYTLENYGESNITWSATVDTNWFTVAPFRGTLAAGESTNLTLALTAASDAM